MGNMNKELVQYIIDLCQNDTIREELINKAIDGNATIEEKFVLSEVYSEKIDSTMPIYNREDELVDYTIEPNNMNDIFLGVTLSYMIGRHFPKYQGKTVELDEVDNVLEQVLVDGTKTIDSKLEFISNTIIGFINKGDDKGAMNFITNFKCNKATLDRFKQIKQMELEAKTKRRSK